MEILGLVIELLVLCNVPTNSLVEGSDISGTIIALTHNFTVTELIGAVQCLDLHLQLRLGTMKPLQQKKMKSKAGLGRIEN